MGIVRGAGVIRWGASDGHSPYIGENGNWWQWNETVGDFVDTGVSAKGVDGMPGQVPIQKEWKEGDTHRNDTNIVDFIYVRAALSADRKWYKLNDNYVTRTVPAGETEPSAATITEYYEEIPWLSALAVNVLIAEEANIANFIFKQGKLISVRGKVNGVEADYAGQPNFIPNIVLDGANGAISSESSNIRGTIHATSGDIGGISISNDHIGDTSGTDPLNKSQIYISTQKVEMTRTSEEGGSVYLYKATLTDIGVKVSKTRLGYTENSIEIRFDGIYRNGIKIL